MSQHCLISHVGAGSSSHCLLGALRIMQATSSVVHGSKLSNAGTFLGTMVGGATFAVRERISSTLPSKNFVNTAAECGSTLHQSVEVDSLSWTTGSLNQAALDSCRPVLSVPLAENATLYGKLFSSLTVSLSGRSRTIDVLQTTCLHLDETTFFVVPWRDSTETALLLTLWCMSIE